MKCIHLASGSSLYVASFFIKREKQNSKYFKIEKSTGFLILAAGWVQHTTNLEKKHMVI